MPIARTLALMSATALAVACAPVERNELGEIAAAGSLDAFSMRVGDCYDDQVFYSDEVSDVPGVPCDEPHDNEVFAVFDIQEGTYPGEERTLEIADEGCLERFESYVGQTYEESALMITNLVPSKGSWHQVADREVICVAYDMELEKLTGSVRGTGM